MAAALLDEAVNLAEAETGAGPGGLGGEEGSKALSITSCGIPLPVSVTDIITYCPAFRPATDLAVGFIEIAIRGLDSELAAFRHGVACVYREIEDRGLQLREVGFSVPQARAPHSFDRDGLAERTVQQVRHAGDQPVDIDRLRVKRLIAGEMREDAWSAPLHAGRRSMRFRAGARGFPSGDAAEGHLKISDDHREQVVEVVRDTPCELADRFHSLRMAHLLFKQFTTLDFGIECRRSAGLVRTIKKEEISAIAGMANC